MDSPPLVAVIVVPIVITNPEEPGKTWLRKIAYRYAYWRLKIKHLFERKRKHE